MRNHENIIALAEEQTTMAGGISHAAKPQFIAFFSPTEARIIRHFKGAHATKSHLLETVPEHVTKPDHYIRVQISNINKVIEPVWDKKIRGSYVKGEFAYFIANEEEFQKHMDKNIKLTPAQKEVFEFLNMGLRRMEVLQALTSISNPQIIRQKVHRINKALEPYGEKFVVGENKSTYEKITIRQ